MQDQITHDLPQLAFSLAHKYIHLNSNIYHNIDHLLNVFSRRIYTRSEENCLVIIKQALWTICAEYAENMKQGQIYETIEIVHCFKYSASI